MPRYPDRLHGRGSILPARPVHAANGDAGHTGIANWVHSVLGHQAGLRVRRSKADQEGRGAEIAILDGRRLRPVEHVKAWLARAALTEGPLFRRLSNDGRCLLATPMSDRAVARVVQQRVV